MMNSPATLAVVLPFVFLPLPGCSVQHEEQHAEIHEITATSPMLESVTITQPFVCQIRSQRHIQVRALERGYLEAIDIKEGQFVKSGEAMFKVVPVIYKARMDAESAEVRQAQLEYNYSKKLAEDRVISENEVAIVKTKLIRAEAKLNRAEAELNFATVRAPFDGIIHRLRCQQGSLVEKGDILTSLSDNSVMWVYFNVPETHYLKSMATLTERKEELKIELILADGEKFNQLGKLGAIEADFDNTTGNISFRADFPNPDRLLRNGQTGTILISHIEKDAVVIPQRSSFEYVDQQCVYVIDSDDVAHRRDIVVKDELEDVFVIEKGVSIDDRIIFEGIRQVRDGEKVEFAFLPPEEVFRKLKFHAE